MIIIDDTERATLRQKVLLWAGYCLFMALLFLTLFLCSCATHKSERVFGPDGWESTNPRT